MRGIIIINNEAGRALRKQRLSLLAGNVLDCSGSFHAGDRIYVTFRGNDGGQYVIAKGIVRYDETALRQIIDRPVVELEKANANDDSAIVIQEQDIELLWPAI